MRNVRVGLVQAKWDGEVTDEKTIEENIERMVKKRQLNRKQTSPKNEFTVLTPLGSFAFEKNSMNRLNRVYLYEPFVDREEMMRFLIAVRNQVLNGSDISYVSASDSMTLSKSLVHKINKIVSGKKSCQK